MSFGDEFRFNPAIASLANIPRWTVSYEKIPIDFHAFIEDHMYYDPNKKTLRPFFAKDHTNDYLVTLDEVSAKLNPLTRINTTFFIISELDRYVILDVEKTCAPELANRLITMDAIYKETSASGLGYHLILPLPSNFKDFGVAHLKNKIQSKDSTYEVLMQHYITFTGEPIPASRMNEAYAFLQTNNLSPMSLNELWELLAKPYTNQSLIRGEKVDLEQPEIPKLSAILSTFGNPKRKNEIYNKTLEDFNNDNSRYEFGLISKVTLAVHGFYYNCGIKVSKTQFIWAVYLVVKKLVEHRPKHDEFRNGMPLLLNATSSLIEKDLNRLTVIEQV